MERLPIEISQLHVIVQPAAQEIGRMMGGLGVAMAFSAMYTAMIALVLGFFAVSFLRRAFGENRGLFDALFLGLSFVSSFCLLACTMMFLSPRLGMRLEPPGTRMDYVPPFLFFSLVSIASIRRAGVRRGTELFVPVFTALGVLGVTLYSAQSPNRPAPPLDYLTPNLCGLALWQAAAGYNRRA